MKKNFLHIDEIRFLMIHLILINHFSLSYYMASDKIDATLTVFWFEMTSPVLALLSGYLFFFGTAGKLRFGEKIKRRVPSLIVPYLIWSVGFYFIYWAIKEIAARQLHLHFWYNDAAPISFQSLLYSLLHPPLVNFWYLQNLILIIPFNFLFYYILKSRATSFLFFAAILIIFAFHLVPLYFQPRFLPFYLIGCYAGYHKLQVPKMRFPFPLPPFQARILTSVCWVPFMIFLGVATGYWEYSSLLVIILKIVVVLLLVVGTWNLIDAYPDSFWVRYLKKYKAYSFFLFAIHTFIFSAVQRPLFRLAGSHLENKYFTLGFSLITAVVVLLICLAMGIIVERHLPRLFGVITGGREPKDSRQKDSRPESSRTEDTRQLAMGS